MVGAIWRAQCAPTAVLSPLPVARTPAPSRAPVPTRTPARPTTPFLALPGLPMPTALSLIGSDSSKSLDDGGGTFRIKKDVYSTANAAGKFQQLVGCCFYVTGSYQSADGKRETLRAHWDTRTQTGDLPHAVIGTGPHTPVVGISGVFSGLDFVRQ